MKKERLFTVLSYMSEAVSAAVEYDASVPQMESAVQELNGALKEVGRENLQVTLRVKSEEASPESFQIRSVGSYLAMAANEQVEDSSLRNTEWIKVGMQVPNPEYHREWRGL